MSVDDSESPSSKLAQLMNSRKYVRQRITKTYNKVETDLSTFSEHDKSMYTERLLCLKNEVLELDRNIIALFYQLGMKDEELDKRIEENETYEEKLFSCLTKLKSTMTTGASPSFQVQNKLKLPEMPLPEFSAEKDQSLEKFFHNFESIIDKHNLSSYEKFVYLRNQVSKSPRILIDSLDIQEQSYEKAKDLLSKAFASPLTKKYEAIQRLSDIKLDYNDDPYTFIGEMRSISNAFNVLKIDTNMVLQYFFWRGLNDRFQTHLIQITNNSKPSLSEINDNIFEATDRYVRHNRKIKETQNRSKFSSTRQNEAKATNVLAANVKIHQNGKMRQCHLCASDSHENLDHSIIDCPVYDTPSKKIDKLKEMNGCTRCSFCNHNTKNCKFRFSSRCRNCNGFHFTYLCNVGTRSSKETKFKVKKSPTYDNTAAKENKNNEPTASTSNGVALIEVFRNNTDDSIILPTFSCKVSCKGSHEDVRILVDSGCQRNFIAEALLAKHDFEILDPNVELNIHGFNSTKTMNAKLVKVTLNIGDECISINALTTPSIRTNLKLEGLNKIIEGFASKGYVLADKFLKNKSEEINNIGILLGEDGNHVKWKWSNRHFGKPVPSSYIETPIGIILAGNVKRMLGNLRYLPSLTTKPMENTEFPLMSTTSNNMPVLNKDSLIYLMVSSNNESSKDVMEGCYDLVESGESDENEKSFETAINTAYSVLDENGELIQFEVEKATKDILDKECARHLKYDSFSQDSTETETNIKLVNYVLDNTIRNNDGRIIMPLMWNSKISHLLGKNFNLSKKILESNYRKLKRNPEKLEMINEVFKEQEKLGIIERIENIDNFMQLHPECCFLPHMPIFKLDRETTKCRVVYLSNLCEKNPNMPATVSNNQAMMPGPCLNHKITTSIMLLRFDLYLIVFDLKKAFLQIGLNEIDQNRLMCLWYRNIREGDYSLIAYRNLRLSFGLRASPCILMLSMFKILILDAEIDDEKTKELKKSVFNLIYMDNGGYSCNNRDSLSWSYKALQDVFGQYKFELQQFATNDLDLQKQIDEEQGHTQSEVKLLGMIWNKEKDTICPQQFHLDAKANTKRLILSTLKSVYDIFGILGPIMNRGNLFLQKLMHDAVLDWDTVLPEILQREWINIVKQVNTTPVISIPRFIGRRDGRYRLICFADSSNSLYASVVYIQDLDSMQISFLMGKNKLVGKGLERKSIPSLEFLAICLGVELVIDIYQSLSGPAIVVPVQIEKIDLFSDSMVALHWLQAYATKYEKMQKRSVFIMNRLRTIDELCRVFPIDFHFIEGSSNPSDALTRPLSYKQLVKTNYFGGPEVLLSTINLNETTDLNISVPNPAARLVDEVADDTLSRNIALSVQTGDAGDALPEHFIPLDKYSSFHRLVVVHRRVLIFINNIKVKLAAKNKITHLKSFDCSKVNLYATVCNQIISTEQRIHYPEIFSFFEQGRKNIHSTPSLVSQLNLVLSRDGLLKVKSKFGKHLECKYPILLPKNSAVTKMIINDVHARLSHAGIYTVLKELRRNFWVTHYYSAVRKVLRECVICKRMNDRPVKLNQSSYRDFRVNPPPIPFRYVFLDYMGPYNVRWNGKKSKVWVLIITCMWSRAINMKICMSADAKEFIRAIQLHVYEFGLFELCMSDLGSQIVAGCNIIATFLDDCDTKVYLESHGIKAVKFDHFAKGNSSLGSLVESCVKLAKKLIYGSIRNNILDFMEFHFIICQTVHLVNKRPIAFKENLRATIQDEKIDVITPEILLKGYELVSVNVIPELQASPDENDPDWVRDDNFPDVARKCYYKLHDVRSKLSDLYHSEFYTTLIKQAIDKRDRYKQVSHKHLQVGDIVLLKEKFLKPSTYPMGIVREVEINALGESTTAKVFKSSSREIVHRHVTSLIRLIPRESIHDEGFSQDAQSLDAEVSISGECSFSKKRLAAEASQRKTRALAHEGVI